jgi:uncharacterized protein (TIGR00730 family)
MPEDASRPIVAVFGAAFLPEDGPAFARALALGRGIARAGWTLASGGFGGTMAAASRGAREAGGRTIGVTCETLLRLGRRPNEWIAEEVRLPTVRERMAALVRMADAAVALDGGIGTLTEISFFATEVQTGELSPRPLILVGSVWRETLSAFLRAAEGYLSETDKRIFTIADTGAEAVDILRGFFSRSGAEKGRSSRP